MRAAPAAIGGMPRSSKRASERQSATSSRSPCTTWIAIAVWPSLKVVNSCARAIGIVAVARNDLLDQPAHRLESERQRDDVEQQPVVAARAVAGERVGLDRRAERDHLVGIEIGQRRLAEELGDRAPHLRHARRAADQHDAIDVARLEPWRRAARAAPAASVLSTRWLRVIAVELLARRASTLDRSPPDSVHAQRRRRRGCDSVLLRLARLDQQQRACPARDSGGSFGQRSRIQQKTR